MHGEFPFNPKLKEGVVDGKMLLKDLFADEAEVNDLLKVFDLNGLEVIKQRYNSKRIKTRILIYFLFL